jgi:hypothetical protein
MLTGSCAPASRAVRNRAFALHNQLQHEDRAPAFADRCIVASRVCTSEVLSDYCLLTCWPQGCRGRLRSLPRRDLRCLVLAFRLHGTRQDAASHHRSFISFPAGTPERPGPGAAAASSIAPPRIFASVWPPRWSARPRLPLLRSPAKASLSGEVSFGRCSPAGRAGFG